MPARAAVKGKKRPAELPDDNAQVEDARPSTSSPPPTKRREFRSLRALWSADAGVLAKRAETRTCPICAEPIPLRLLPAHDALESQRVHAILDHVGDLEVWSDPHAGAHDTAYVQFPVRLAHRLDPRPRSTSRRRSTIPVSTSTPASSDRLVKALNSFKKRRRQRNTALREATRDDDEPPRGKGKGKARAQGESCPVCFQLVHGDPDVVRAHVDACLAHAELSFAHSPSAEEHEDLDIEGEDEDEDPWEESTAADGVARLRLRASRAQSVRRLGFEVRAAEADDVEVEVDVEGDDQDAFGGAQFSGADVLALESVSQEPTLPVRPSRISIPRTLIALQATETPPDGSGCRICLDAYTEPTVSTGCWHACCRACWLRCLGTAGVCPICKRITAASELRRVYL
ncbi:hypothetical protein BV25DRAFT_1368355 [Artomyces pyxidatus]|uniref:Uncharacterized protein n=1 Tax=Artomyces pyxidatus TaxID=48021 RepID=A0ACB8SME8_9AGAM|nr:hypothetical protein BV25DRAFT_1368355 [Artomyces pyxidatus]